MRGKDIRKFGFKCFVLIYSAQLSVVSEPQGPAGWVTIAGETAWEEVVAFIVL